jgi:phage FluMu protein Com
MNEYRCRGCNKLLFRASLGPDSRIEIPCRGCKVMNEIATQGAPQALSGRLVPDGSGGFTLEPATSQ